MNTTNIRSLALKRLLEKRRGRAMAGIKAGPELGPGIPKGPSPEKPAFHERWRPKRVQAGTPSGYRAGLVRRRVPRPKLAPFDRPIVGRQDRRW